MTKSIHKKHATVLWKQLMIKSLLLQLDCKNMASNNSMNNKNIMLAAWTYIQQIRASSQ